MSSPEPANAPADGASNVRAVNIRAMVEQVVKNLVAEPGQVSVAEERGGRETVLNLRVAPKDIGKIIGRQGRTIRSLRILVDSAASKLEQRYSLELIEPEFNEKDDEDAGEAVSNPE